MRCPLHSACIGGCFLLFSHDFTMQLLNTAHLAVSALRHAQFWMDYFPVWPNWSLTREGGCDACNDIRSWRVSSRSFSCAFATKLLYNVTSCRVRSTARAVVDEFFPYLVHLYERTYHIMTSDLYIVKLFGCGVVYILDYIHMWQQFNPWGDDVSLIISTWVGHGHTGHSDFCGKGGGVGVGASQ